MFRTTAVVCFLAFIAVAGSGRLAAGQAAWIEAQSPNFIVRTDAGEDQARDLVWDLERFRFVVGLLAGLDLSVPPSPPLRIYAYGRLEDYARAYDMEGTAGFYFSRPDGSVAVLSLEDGEEIWEIKGRHTVFHEYTHHLLNHHSPYEYPRWYNEGFAEFISTMEFEGDTAIIGRPPVHRFIALKRGGKWLKLSELVESRGRYIGYMGGGLSRDPNRGRVGILHQYAQGWLLTHFLNNNEELRGGVTRYIAALNRPGIDEAEAFEKAFGMSYREMDLAVREYWHRYELPLSAADLSGRLPEFRTGIRVLSASESAAVTYEGRMLTGKIDSGEDEARAAFEAALMVDAAAPRMRENLVQLALFERSWDAARGHIERLLGDHPEKAAAAYTYMAHLLLAETETESEESATDADLLQEIRRYCLRAIKADPTHVPALLAYLRLALEEDRELTDTELKVVDSVRYLAPGSRTAQEIEARILARAGHIERARPIVMKLIEWSGSRAEAHRYEDLLEEIEALAEKRQG